MKLQKIILNYLILLFAFQICFGQEKPKAELVDEFGNITWEDFVQRLDQLFVTLWNKEDSSAYIVIYKGKAEGDKSNQGIRYEQWAKGHIRVRGGSDKNRIFIIRAEDKNALRIQLWVVPAGAEKPVFNETEWDLTIPSNKKSFIFTTTESNNGLATPAEHLSLNLFSELLEVNPAARGNFVIRARSKREFREEQTLIIKTVEKYKIPTSRLRFFFIRENKQRWDYPQTEVWIVLKNKS